ncbi:MAG: FKBP-type peptidyl-prolyl cis-trans isomerase [Nitrospiraceae bacterium]|nr:FKBP-type peptidyl-prolyl cis-trans isomerase [Nitrospiraceae bacterium]
MRVFWAVALCTILLGAQAYGVEQSPLKDKKDKLSYSIGLDVGNALKRQGVDVNMDVMMRGVKDAVSGGKKLLTDEEVRDTMTEFSKELAAKKAEETKKIGEENKKAGETFLAENTKKEGVKTLPNGLQYKIITEGKGESPKASDTVTVNYKGTFIDGKEFDSSYKRGKPATFAVKGVIPGWTEALQMMKVGSKWELFIPPALAYGERGAGGVIGPEQTLIFEVELLSIKEKAGEDGKK